MNWVDRMRDVKNAKTRSLNPPDFILLKFGFFWELVNRKEVKKPICEKCEYKPTLKRNLEHPPTKEEIKYAQLWEEIELPELLKERGFLKENFNGGRTK